MNVFFTFALLVSTSVLAAPQSIRDILSMHNRADGKYDVLCMDGTRQTITQTQLQSDNVCGTSADMSFIESMQTIDDRIYVICQDLTFEAYVDYESIITGKTCSYRTLELLGEGSSSRINGDRTLAPYQVVIQPVKLTRPIQTTRWGVLIDQKDDPAMSIAIYTDDNGKPGTLLAQSGKMDVDGGRNEIFSAVPVSLAPGNYWIGAVVETELTFSTSEMIVPKTYSFLLPNRLSEWPATLDVSTIQPDGESNLLAIYTMNF